MDYCCKRSDMIACAAKKHVFQRWKSRCTVQNDSKIGEKYYKKTEKTGNFRHRTTNSAKGIFVSLLSLPYNAQIYEWISAFLTEF